MTSDLLVNVVTQLRTADGPIVASSAVKATLSANSERWGFPHGWRIRDAEDAEFERDQPRLVKWRLGSGTTGLIGYSLVDDAAAATLANQQGYTRLRG